MDTRYLRPWQGSLGSDIFVRLFPDFLFGYKANTRRPSHLTFSRGPKDPSSGNKMAWLKEKQSTAKNAKETDSTRNISGDIKPTHKRTHSADVSSSAGNTTNTKIIYQNAGMAPAGHRVLSRCTLPLCLGVLGACRQRAWQTEVEVLHTL